MKEETAGAKVARGATLIFLQGVISNLLALAYLWVAQIILAPEELGLLIGLALIATLVVTLGTLAIPSSVVRYASKMIGLNLLSGAQRLWRSTIVIGFLLSGILSVLTYVFASTLAILFVGNQVFTLFVQLIAIDVFVAIFSNFFVAPILATQRFSRYALYSIFVTVLRTAVPVLLLFVGYGVFGVVISWVIADTTKLILFGFTAFLWGGIGSIKTPMRNFFKYSFSLYGSKTVSFFSSYMERYLVLFTLDLASIAFYEVAIAVASVISMSAVAISQTLLPVFANLYGSGGTANMRQASKKAVRYVMLTCVPASVGIALVADVLYTAMRPVYSAAIIPTVILCLATTVLSINVVLESLLLSVGKARRVLESNLLGIASNIIVSILLLPIIGVFGAALGRTAYILFTTFYAGLILKREKALEFRGAGSLRIITCVIIMALAVIVTRLIFPVPQMLSVFVLVGFGVFILSVRFTGVMTTEDYILVEQLLPRRLKGLTPWISRILGKRNNQE